VNQNYLRSSQRVEELHPKMKEEEKKSFKKKVGETTKQQNMTRSNILTTRRNIVYNRVQTFATRLAILSRIP
jgi:hypothetical protein